MEFFADHMLKRLSKWLRFMGYDVQYPEKDTDDNGIVDLCSKEGKILLTRDQELYGRVPRSILVRSDNFKQQVLQVISQYPPDETKFFTRCPECNGILLKEDVDHISSQVPVRIRESGKEIQICGSCGKAYWEGSHYDSILSELRKFTEENR